MIAWLPFTFFLDLTSKKYNRLLLLLKVTRIMEGIKVFDIGYIMGQL